MLQPGPVLVENEEDEKKEDKETELTTAPWRRPAKKAGNMMFLHEFK